jgi:ribosomal-protein-alanine N-acetyltransferase
MILSDGQIMLRPPTDYDIPKIAKLANNKKVWDNLRDYMPYPYSESDASSFVNQVKNENPAVTFAIEYNNEFCGFTGLKLQTDVYKKSAEIGYWLGEPFWGKGIMTKAVKLLTAYAFSESFDFVRLYAGVFDYNAASMRVLEKNGYEKEGISQKHIFKNGKIYDEHRYFILK